MTTATRPHAMFPRVLLLPLAVILMLGVPAVAQVTVGAPSVMDPSPVAVNGQRLAADFAVAAGADPGMQIVFPAMLSALDGGADLPLRWIRTETGAEAAAGRPVALAPGSVSTFRLEADLPDLGRYAVQLAVRQAGAGSDADQVLGPFVFARAPIPIPADFLPATLRQAATVWPWLPPTAAGVDARILVAIEGRNATDQTFGVGAASWGALSREGSVAETVDLSLPVNGITGTPTCGAQVAPGARCTLEMQLPGLLTPGRYGLDVLLQGAEGGASATRITLDVRAPGWLAALIVAAGALLGATVAHWRDVDRPRALAELPLVLLAEDFRRLARNAQSRDVAAVAQDRVAQVEAALRHGRLGLPDAAPDTATLSTERDILRRAEQGIAAVTASGLTSPGLTAAMRAVTGSLRAEPWAADTTATALETLDLAWKDEVTRQTRREFETESTAETGQIQLPTGLLLPGVEADARTFAERIKRMDLGAALFMAALIGLGGVAVLWVGDPTWGSGLDLATAFAAGVATRMTLPSPAAKPFG